MAVFESVLCNFLDRHGVFASLSLREYAGRAKWSDVVSNPTFRTSPGRSRLTWNALAAPSAMPMWYLVPTRLTTG